jgi:tetratricopeptide (TPR) repeat protein
MRYLLLTTLLFIGVTSFAQKTVKDGIRAYEMGNYANAVDILSLEVGHADQLKPKDRADGWYYLGKAKSILITNAMALQEAEKLQELLGYDLDAYLCFKKALLEKDNDNRKSEIVEEIKSISYVIFNSGNTQYLLNQNAYALKFYNVAQEIAEEYGMRNDYQVYQYKAQTQLTMGDSTRAFDNYKKSILRYNSQAPEIPDANIGYAFYTKAVIERYTLKDLDNALLTVQEGMTLLDEEVFRLKTLLSEGPSNSQMLAQQEAQFASIRATLTRFELDIYSASPEKYDEAVAKFQKAISENPNDANLHLVYGNLIEYKDIDGAFEAYKQAISIDPNDPAAQFNAGANRVNKGAEYARLANAEIDFQKADTWKEKADEQFKLAFTYIEKAHSFEPNDVYILDALIQVTAQLEMTDAYTLYKAKRRAISGN